MKALDAAFGGVEFKIDVGRIGKRVFLNNVSFGIYADALSDPDYRSHRAESIIDATEETIEDPDTRLSVQDPAGTTYDDIEILLASNNPYRFIGPPDFAGRASLDTGTLGVILVDRTAVGDTDLEHSDIQRWSAPTMTVASTKKKVHVGIDGSLHGMKAPVDIGVENKALRVVLGAELVKREIQESFAPVREALAHLSGAST